MKNLLRVTISLTILDILIFFGIKLANQESISIFAEMAYAQVNQESAEEKITLPKDTKVRLGQPANYPHDIVEALVNYFKTNSNVKAAYLAHIFAPESQDPPHNVIGIMSDGDIGLVIKDMGEIIARFSPEGGFVDFVDVNRTGTISDYMKKDTQPFYVREKSNL